MAGEALEQFEERFFADDSLFQELLVAEDELIDESLANELNETERELFATNFLNLPERKQKLLFRSVLRGYVERKKPQQVAPRGWGFLTGTVYPFRTAIIRAALVIVAATIAIVPFMYHYYRTVTFATVNLSMGVSERTTDGAQIPKVKLPLNVDELRLNLELPEPGTDGQTYRVELVRRVNGKMTKLEPVSQDKKSVVVAISDSQLEPGGHALNLFTTKPHETEQRIGGSYLFTAE